MIRVYDFDEIDFNLLFNWIIIIIIVFGIILKLIEIGLATTLIIIIVMNIIQYLMQDKEIKKFNPKSEDKK